MVGCEVGTVVGSGNGVGAKVGVGAAVAHSGQPVVSRLQMPQASWAQTASQATLTQNESCAATVALHIGSEQPGAPVLIKQSDPHMLGVGLSVGRGSVGATVGLRVGH